MSASSIAIGIVGARGYVGAKLIRLIATHPQFELAFVSSRELNGQRVADCNDTYTGKLRFSAPYHEKLPALGADAVVLALPNGKASVCVQAFDAALCDPVIIDLSADYRFDNGWYYGLPELTRGSYGNQRRISNPGCYATAIQLAVAPMRGVLDAPVQCFGVSGYSGAGTAPSDKNNPQKLRDNLMPYALTGHIHEREASQRLDHAVEFMPHVGPHFRGLAVTVNLHLENALDHEAVIARYRQHYAGEPLIRVLDTAPWISNVANTHYIDIGGFTLAENARRLVVVATLDNLLKGAATQAVQNLNRAFGLPELTGIQDGASAKPVDVQELVL